MKCQWYVSIEQPECGKEPAEPVRIKTKEADATVDLCRIHKARYNDKMMQKRHALKAARNG